MAVDYATIVAGRVTAVTLAAVSLPASDATTLYHNLAGYDPYPEVADYFEEQCQTFSTAPPVIPIGEIAPPYPPGSEQPNPSDPEFPEEEDGGEPQYPPPNVVDVPLSFHANHADVLTVAAVPADLAEIDVTLRTRMLLFNCCRARVETYVVTPLEGAELWLCWIDPIGPTLRPLSRLETGPSVDVGTGAGGAESAFYNVHPDAIGDVTLTLATKGGDGASSLVLGNTLAILGLKTEDGARCIELEEEAEDCALPESMEAIDFGAFDTLSDVSDFCSPRSQPTNFYSISDSGASAPLTTIDLATTHNGVRTMRMQWDASAGLAPHALYASLGGPAVTDMASWHVFMLGAGFDTAGNGSANEGICIADASIYNDNYYGVRFLVSDGRLEYKWDDGSGFGAPVDLGPVADWLDRFVRFILRVKLVSSTTVNVELYLDDACSLDRTLLYSQTETLTNGPEVGLNMDITRFNTFDNPSTDIEAWDAAYAYDEDVTTLGLAA